MLTIIVAAYGGLVLFVLPGLAVLSVIWRGRAMSLADRLGLACGTGLCVYPLLLEWLYVFRIPAGRPVVVWVGISSVLCLILRHRRSMTRVLAWRPARRSALLGEDRQGWFFCLFLLLGGLLLVSRLTSIRGMVAPAWGDSVHHTVIVQLLLDHGGLFRSWEPYAPIASFTYHFGFHANAAAWVWLTGMAAPQAVLVTGQVCNVLAVLALFPLATRLCGNRWAAGATVLVAGFLCPLPAYFANWGRYTQLTGLAILPALLCFFDMWWAEDRRPPLRTLVPIPLLLSGVVLAHYRLAVLAGAAGAAWALWGLLCRPARRSDWCGSALAMTGAGLISGALLAPWLMTIVNGRYGEVMGTVSPAAQQAYYWTDLKTWTFIPSAFWIVACVALGGAIWAHRRLAVPLVLWLIFSFVAVNPFLVGLPGTGWIMNDTLIYTLYVPISLCVGWVCGRIATMTIVAPRFRLAVALVGIAAVVAGIGYQRRIVGPFYQMVTPTDLAAFDWIRRAIPGDAVFLVNGFIRQDNFVVGSDAGWWLPYYTRRRNTVPPALYHTERLSPSVRREAYVELVAALQACRGQAEAVRSILSRYGITHVFLGERRGSVGYGITQLVPEQWLRSSSDFTLLYQAGRAQVWRLNETRRRDSR